MQSLRLVSRIIALGLIVALALLTLTPGQRPALAASAGPWAWGGNWSGQFGDGTTTSSSVPILLTHARQVVSFGAGAGHTAILSDDGTVSVWGYNRNGELASPITETCVGDGEARPCKVPIQVPGINDGMTLSTGAYHTLLLRRDGTLWAWGFNGYGQLGSITGEICSAGVMCSSTPMQVPGLANLAAFAGGHLHSLALKTDGSVWAWGGNYVGQLGAATSQTCQFGLACSSAPLQVPGLPGITAIAAGSVNLADHSLALAQDGTVWAWGKNDTGQLGVATSGTCYLGIACSPSPIMIAGLSGGAPVTALAVGAGHSLALKADGTVWAWGDNSQGELGDGTFTNHLTPMPVLGLSDVVSITAGYNDSLALKRDGTVWAWGRNNDGQLGDSTTTNRSTPVQVAGLSGITHIAAGDAHVLAMQYVVDSTPPVITPHITGTLGANDWYTSDVSISWSISDLESPVTASMGCDPITINTDTAGASLTCAATSGGGTASQSVTIKRDATAPSISAAPDRAANAHGWYNADVLISFTCSDDGAGIASCPAAQTLGEGAGQSADGTAVDAAGNTATAGVQGINVDTTLPLLSGAPASPTNSAGWYNSDVTLHWTCSDALSGIDGACPADSIITGEGSNLAISASVRDNAGNGTTTTVDTINIDRTRPTITAAATSVPNGVNGWYTRDVVVHFTCTDSGAGIPAGSCPADQTLRIEGAAVTSAAQTVTDAAGNTSDPSNIVTVKIDKTAPSLNPVVSPSPVLLKGTATASAGAADGLSGIATLSCGALATNSVGPKSVTCTATDIAGNTNSATATYRVIYRFDGFRQPINDTAHPLVCGSPCPTSIFEGGSTVPVKFQLKDANGILVRSAALPMWLTPVKGGWISAKINERTYTEIPSIGTTYRWNGQEYQYNWKTKGCVTNFTWRIGVTLDDGQTYYVYVGLR